MPTRAQLEQLLESDPEDVFLHYAVAKACVSEGDVAAGLDRFDLVIQKDPDYVPAYFQKAQVLAEQGQTGAARQAVTEGIQVASKVGDTHAQQEMTEFLQGLPP